MLVAVASKRAGQETAFPVPGENGRPSKAQRGDGVVLRPSGPWSATVHALLRHLEAVGFSAAPRVIGGGFADDGRETLSFAPGTSPQPHPWSDDAVAEIGRLLRQLHWATAAFAPPAGARWQPWFGRHLPGSDRVISHCDLGPWNIIARGGLPVAFVDWEFAGPVERGGTWPKRPG